MRALASVFAMTLSMGLLTKAEAQTFQPNTTWENGRGSEFTITTISGDGAVAGTYTNRAAGFACQNTPYPLAGWIDGDKIAFSVRWKSSAADCASITSWTGYFAAGRIVSDWSLIYMDAAEARPLLYRGTDFFTKR